jgi:hypothetical protein
MTDNDITSFYTELKKDLSSIKDDASKLVELVDQAIENIGFLQSEEEELERFIKEVLLDESFQITLGRQWDETYRILYTDVEEALDSVPEFNKPEFNSRLFLALDNSDTLYARRIGRNRVSVELDLERTAGTLEDYVAGIEYFRSIYEEELDRKKPYDPDKASELWARIYNKQGPMYNATIQARLEGFSALAPWWNLVDQGVPQPGATTEDRGEGYATPTSSATNFKEKAERNMERHLSEMFSREVNRQEEIANNRLLAVERTIDDIYNLIDEVEDLINDTKFENYRKRLEVALDEVSLRFEERFYLKYGKKATYRDIDKVRELSRNIAANQPVPNRIQIQGIRIRTIKMQQHVEQLMRYIKEG